MSGENYSGHEVKSGSTSPVKEVMKSMRAHRDDSLLLHAARCVVEVSELHGHLVVDGQEELLALLQLGLQLFAVGGTQLRGPCRQTKSQRLQGSRYLQEVFVKGISDQKLDPIFSHGATTCLSHDNLQSKFTILTAHPPNNCHLFNCWDQQSI